MAKASNRSLAWLHLAVLGPLVLLAALAWWGTQSQLKAAWTEAREEAERLAPELADALSNELEASIVKIPNYPDPPTPKAGASGDDLLDSVDLKVLGEIAADPKAGLSSAGLPRRVLAALRIEQLAPGTQPRASLVALLTKTAPSVLSQPALKKLKPSPAELADWQQEENARMLARSLPKGEAGWFPDLPPTTNQGKSKPVGSFLRAGETTLDFIPSSTVQALLKNQQQPNRYSLDLGRSGAPDERRPTALALSPLQGPGESLLLGVNIGRGMVEGPIRRQQRWTLALLATALLTASISLFSIHRTVARERRLAELKSQFVSSVSHELRAPLGSIRLMAEALQQEKVRKPAEFHTLIAREGTRLSHLIENVLDFARIEEGRKSYRFEECDLTALVRDTLRLMQPLAEDHGVHLAFDLPEITASLDPASLQQALVNLIDNAIKFSPVGGIVHLDLQSNDDRWQLAIRDHGPGIPAKQHARVFERFHRLGNELRRETQGTGIGLSIVKHIAEAHGGTIAIDSTPPDGATFTLSIPLEPCAS